MHSLSMIRREKLRKYIKENFKNRAEFASKINKQPSQVAMWFMNTDGRRNIGEKIAREIEETLSLPSGWLDYQNDKNSQKTIEPNASWLGQMEPWDDDTPLEDDEVELPFFKEIEASAGNGRAMVQENHGRKLRFSKNTLRRYGVQPDSAYCVVVSGNSMEPAIPEGSTIGIDTSKTDIKDGDIYALDHDGHLRVKVVYKMPDGIRLKSYNTEEWPDENYSEEKCKKIRILGRVFWWSVLR